MDDVILIGANGDSRPYQAAGLSCFEPAEGRVAERVLAERSRCEVLAMTPAAFESLPSELGSVLRESIWPEVVILPPVDDVAAAARIADQLRRTAAARQASHAAA